MAEGRHFEKKPINSPYLCNRLADFDEIFLKFTTAAGAI